MGPIHLKIMGALGLGLGLHGVMSQVVFTGPFPAPPAAGRASSCFMLHALMDG